MRPLDGFRTISSRKYIKYSLPKPHYEYEGLSFTLRETMYGCYGITSLLLLSLGGALYVGYYVTQCIFGICNTNLTVHLVTWVPWRMYGGCEGARFNMFKYSFVVHWPTLCLVKFYGLWPMWGFLKFLKFFVGNGILTCQFDMYR